MAELTEPGASMSEQAPAHGPDSRPARAKAIEAAVLWASALVVTVGLSTWLGTASVEPVWGIPRWALYGIFAPWILFFLLHLRFCRRRPSRRSKP